MSIFDKKDPKPIDRNLLILAIIVGLCSFSFFMDPGATPMVVKGTFKAMGRQPIANSTYARPFVLNEFPTEFEIENGILSDKSALQMQKGDSVTVVISDASDFESSGKRPDVIALAINGREHLSLADFSQRKFRKDVRLTVLTFGLSMLLMLRAFRIVSQRLTWIGSATIVIAVTLMLVFWK